MICELHIIVCATLMNATESMRQRDRYSALPWNGQGPSVLRGDELAAQPNQSAQAVRCRTAELQLDAPCVRGTSLLRHRARNLQASQMPADGCSRRKTGGKEIRCAELSPAFLSESDGKEDVDVYRADDKGQSLFLESPELAEFSVRGRRVHANTLYRPEARTLI